MSHKILTDRRTFWSLAFVATILFLAHGDAGGGSRALKSLWEGRGKEASEQMTGQAGTASITVYASAPGRA